MYSIGDAKSSLSFEKRKSNNENSQIKNLRIEIDEDNNADKETNFINITKNINKKEQKIITNDKENQSLICNSPQSSKKFLNKKTSQPISNHNLSSETINILNKIINNKNNQVLEKNNIKEPEYFKKNPSQKSLNTATKNKNMELSSKALETIKKLKDKQNLKNKENSEKNKNITIENSFSLLNIKYK